MITFTYQEKFTTITVSQENRNISQSCEEFPLTLAKVIVKIKCISSRRCTLRNTEYTKAVCSDYVQTRPLPILGLPFPAYKAFATCSHCREVPHCLPYLVHISVLQRPNANVTWSLKPSQNPPLKACSHLFYSPMINHVYLCYSPYLPTLFFCIPSPSA